MLVSLTPKMDIVSIQEHKLRRKLLENLGPIIMIGCTSWILEATQGERSWCNLNVASKDGVGVLLDNKCAGYLRRMGPFNIIQLYGLSSKASKGVTLG